MKFKKIILLIIYFFVIFTLSACNSKKTINTEEFNSKVSQMGYQVVDVTNQYTSNNNIKSAVSAKANEGYSILFFVFDDDVSATSMFNSNKNSFESYRSKVDYENSISFVNYSSYALTSSGYYMYTCRIDNTLIYVKAPDTYKENIKKLVKSIDY